MTTKSRKLSKKHKTDLPYWPSQAFLDSAIAMLKEKGMEAPDSVLREMVIKGYRQKRAEILAKELVP